MKLGDLVIAKQLGETGIIVRWIGRQVYFDGTPPNPRCEVMLSDGTMFKCYINKLEVIDEKG